jgi:ATP-dependent helicase YprA (DUF1998 family)
MDTPCPSRSRKTPARSDKSKHTDSAVNQPNIPQSTQKRPGYKSQTLAELSRQLVEGLHLSFTPDEWQVRCIKEILQKKDVIIAAGTGYGKSLIFEGLALFNRKKTVIVICPLKALELDQVGYPVFISHHLL